MTPAEEWLARIKGRETYLSELATLFGGTQARIIKKNDAHYLGSSEFASMANPTEVLRAAVEIVRRMNAVGMLRIARFDPVEVVNVVRTDTHGDVREHYVTMTSTIRFSGSAGVSTSGSHSRVELDWMLTLASCDPAVDDAFRCLTSNEPTWIQCYKLFEIVRDDVGSNNLKKYGSASDFDKLTATANHPAASGDEGRHARMRGRGPSRTMSQREATNFIRDVVDAWLNDKRVEHGI